MKTEEIDKKIGMPDIDAEWARFESDIIDNESNIVMFNKKKKSMIKKIAASVAIILCISGVAIASVFHRSAEENKEVKVDTSVETKPMVEYRDIGFKDRKPRYVVNLCPGTWIKNHEGKEYIEEEILRYAYVERGYTIAMMLNGEPFDKNSLPLLTNKDLKKIEASLVDGKMTINLITKETKMPASIMGNLPRVITILLPGKGEIDIVYHKAQEGNWMNCSCTSWNETSYGWSVSKEFERVKKVQGFKAYIYSSTETLQKDIDRATAMLQKVGIENISYQKDIPIKHFSDAELRQWAEKEKASGTPFDKLYDKMAPQGMALADVRAQWHIVKEVYGYKK